MIDLLTFAFPATPPCAPATPPRSCDPRDACDASTVYSVSLHKARAISQFLLHTFEIVETRAQAAQSRAPVFVKNVERSDDAFRIR